VTGVVRHGTMLRVIKKKEFVKTADEWKRGL
jgi:hypothetical protein